MFLTTMCIVTWPAYFVFFIYDLKKNDLISQLSLILPVHQSISSVGYTRRRFLQ